MKIGINGRFLTHKITGVERVAHNILTHLLDYDKQNEYFLYSPVTDIEEKWKSFSNLKINKSNIKITAKRKLHLWEQSKLESLAKQDSVEVLYNPINTAPIRSTIPTVLHLHGIEFMLIPYAYSRSFRLYYNFLIPRIAASAAKIITVSNHSKKDIVEHLKVQPEKIKVIYNAVDESFFIESSSLQTLETPSKKDYILFVGSTSPVKNIKTLIEAYRIYLSMNTENPLKLVIVGCSNSNFQAANIDTTGLENMVELTGYIEIDKLIQYYREAKIFVFPSLYEAFGLPPLEAMASGTPVIISNTSSLPEIIGEAGILVDPKNPHQIAEKIRELTNNKHLYHNLQSKGLERASEFSWRKSAIHLLETFSEI